MSEFASRYTQPVFDVAGVRDLLGVTVPVVTAAPGASVLVRRTGTSTPAAVYSGRVMSNATLLANPLPTGVSPGSPGLDVYGNLAFWAPAGTENGSIAYEIVVTIGSTTVGPFPIGTLPPDTAEVATSVDVVALGTALDAQAAALVAEAATRGTDDDDLVADLATEAATRLAATSTLATTLAAEAAARTSADSTLASDIAGLDVDLGAVDTALGTEITNRTSAVAAEASARTAADLTKLPLAGGTLTGPLTLSANASTALQPATKQQVDAANAAEAARATAAEGANATNIATNATAISAETTRATAAEGLKLAKASNLSDLASAATARTNLGLGSAATQAAGAFDAAGAASAAQAASQPVDSDLTAIAALSTTPFGRGLLALADGAALAGSIPPGTYVPADPVVVLTYNADGTVATATENGILTTFAYNGDGTVATTTRLGVTRTYTYTDGNLTGVA